MSVSAKLVISSGDVWLGIYGLHKSWPPLHLPAAPVSLRSRQHTARFLRPLGARTTAAEVFAYLTDFILFALIAGATTRMPPSRWMGDSVMFGAWHFYILCFIVRCMSKNGTKIMVGTLFTPAAASH